jgi:hypothetical protein
MNRVPPGIKMSLSGDGTHVDFQNDIDVVERHDRREPTRCDPSRSVPSNARTTWHYRGRSCHHHARNARNHWVKIIPGNSRGLCRNTSTGY